MKTKAPQPEKDEPEERPPPAESVRDSTDLRALIGQLYELPKTVWILSLGMFINRFGTFVVPFLLLYMKESGFPMKVYTLTMLSMAAGGMTSSFLGGWLADRIGRRNTMAIALFGGGGSMVLLWQADSLLGFLLGGLCAGLTHGLYHPASSSLLVDVVPKHRRVTAFAVVRWALNLGFAGGMAAGGFLAERSYALLFLGDAITSFVFGAIVITSIPHGIRVARHEARWKPALDSIFANRRFIAMWFANLLAASLFFQWGAAVSLFVVDLGYSKSVYGWIMALNGVMIAVCELPLSQIGRRYTPRLVIAAGFFFCGLGVFLNLFAISWVWIVIACVVFTVGEMLALPIASAYIGELAPEKMRGRYSGVVSLTWHLSHAYAPALGVTLYLWKPEALWSLSLLAGIAAAGILWRMK